MLKKFFNRANVTLAKPEKPATIPPVKSVVIQNRDRLEIFKEDWKKQWETSHEVIEGNGSDTDWSTWMEALEAEEKLFAPTVPMPPSPK
jgi:hypothetical protein